LIPVATLLIGFAVVEFAALQKIAT
jgi:hypothetical protein